MEIMIQLMVSKIESHRRRANSCFSDYKVLFHHESLCQFSLIDYQASIPHCFSYELQYKLQTMQFLLRVTTELR